MKQVIKRYIDNKKYNDCSNLGLDRHWLSNEVIAPLVENEYKTIEYSEEKIYHYRCSKCSQWFSISGKFLSIIYCPACGDRSEVKKIYGE